MQPALLIRLRPLAPFRFGPASGARDQTDFIFHSDSLYAAVSIAMRQLGRLSDWLGATAGDGQPAVRLSSLFPYLGKPVVRDPTPYPLAAAGNQAARQERPVHAFGSYQNARQRGHL